MFRWPTFKWNDYPTLFRGRDRLALGLLALRVVLALYLIQWGILHFVYTGAAIEVYQRWFGFSPSEFIGDGIGLALIIASLMTAAGLGCRIGYGIGVLFLGAMVIGLLPHLIDPYGFHEPPNWINHGLIAQVPTLAGYIALYMLRNADTLSLDKIIDDKRDTTPARWKQIAPGDATAANALLFIRITAALFFLQWGVEKFVMTEMSVGMMERWYGIGSAQEAVTFATGVFEIVLALALLTGTLRRLTYAIATLVKLKTCWAIAALLLFPFATENGGRLSTVAASVPTAAVLWFIYWTRAWDTASIDARRAPSLQHQ